MPLTHLIIRTRDLNVLTQAGGPPRPQSPAMIDHICYTLVEFDRDKAKAELTGMGLKNVRDGGLCSVHVDDPFGYDVQISGLSSNVLNPG